MRYHAVVSGSKNVGGGSVRERKSVLEGKVLKSPRRGIQMGTECFDERCLKTSQGQGLNGQSGAYYMNEDVDSPHIE